MNKILKMFKNVWFFKKRSNQNLKFKTLTANFKTFLNFEEDLVPEIIQNNVSRRYFLDFFMFFECNVLKNFFLTT